MEIVYRLFPSDIEAGNDLDRLLSQGHSSRLVKFFYHAGALYPVRRTHIRSLLDNAGLFGFSGEELAASYATYREPFGFEGLAREEILMRAFTRGWIRIAIHTDDREGFSAVFNYDAQVICEDVLAEITTILERDGYIRGHSIIRLPISDGKETP